MVAKRSHSSVDVGPFPNIHFLHRLRPTRIKLGLENIARLLERLGAPQKRFPAVLVAGTNGKGSATAFISSILRAGGLKTGIFYSPHLFRINERIQIDGTEIPSPVLDDILRRPVRWYEETPFTFFEGLTAAAILHFVREKVDVAVFEVGLGGRLDATRLVNSACSVITGISYDHREHLGITRIRILGEKLGITKGTVPLVANLGTAALVKAARRHCEAGDLPFHSVRDEVQAHLEGITPGRMAFDLVTPRRSYSKLGTRLIGMAQLKNAATAVRTVEVLAESGIRARRAASSYVKRGLASAFLPGRFQTLPGNPRIVLDVAHNEESLLASLDTLRRISPPRRSVIIFGILAHKELGTFPARAVKSAREIILVPLRNRRSASAKDLMRFFIKKKGGSGREYASIRAARGMAEAVRTARKLLEPHDTLLIFGSHLTVEEAAGCL